MDIVYYNNCNMNSIGGFYMGGPISMGSIVWIDNDNNFWDKPKRGRLAYGIIQQNVVKDMLDFHNSHLGDRVSIIRYGEVAIPVKYKVRANSKIYWDAEKQVYTSKKTQYYVGKAVMNKQDDLVRVKLELM